MKTVFNPGDLVVCWGATAAARGKHDVGVVIKILPKNPNDYHLVLMPDGKTYHYTRYCLSPV